MLPPCQGRRTSEPRGFPVQTVRAIQARLQSGTSGGPTQGGPAHGLGPSPLFHLSTSRLSCADASRTSSAVNSWKSQCKSASLHHLLLRVTCASTRRRWWKFHPQTGQAVPTTKLQAHDESPCTRRLCIWSPLLFAKPIPQSAQISGFGSSSPSGASTCFCAAFCKNNLMRPFQAAGHAPQKRSH